MFPFMKIKNRQEFHTHQQVAASFIEAVKANSDDAWQFVSKVYSPGLDLNELHEMLTVSSQFVKWTTKATYMSDPKNCKTRSVYLEDPVRNLRRILHLRMIKEPGRNGNWKICGVEQEECAKI